MKTLRIILIAAAFISVVLLGQGVASARSRFYIGFGTSVGHCHSSFHRSHYPYSTWHSGCYDWPGHGCYGSWSYYPTWYSCSSGTSIHIGSYQPVYVRRPVVETRRVVIRNRAVAEPKRIEYRRTYEPANEKLFAKVRNKKSELLKVLKIGDKAGRIGAISELAGYSFDDKVRKALEEILLTDPDAELRKHVAESLGKVKNVSLIPVLEKVRVQDADIQVRLQADKAIKNIKSY